VGEEGGGGGGGGGWGGGGGQGGQMGLKYFFYLGIVFFFPAELKRSKKRS